jgi:ATP-dependent Lon protease
LELAKDRLKQGIQAANGIVSDDPGNGTAFTIEAFNQALEHLANLDDAEQLTDLVSATLLRNAGQRQVILETAKLEDRLRHLVRFLQTEKPDVESEP